MTRMTADDWADESLAALLASSRRRGRLARERYPRPADAKLREEQAYDQETEQLRRFIAGQNERKTA